jgi:hypothetical protein
VVLRASVRVGAAVAELACGYSVGAVFETARYSASLCPYRTSRTINRGSPARTVSVNETLTVPDRQHRQQKGNKQRMPCSKRSRTPRQTLHRLLPSADVAAWTRSDLRKAAMACTHGVGRGAAVQSSPPYDTFSVAKPRVYRTPSLSIMARWRDDRLERWQ